MHTVMKLSIFPFIHSCLTVSESLKGFMHEKRISLENKHPLALTFSFPCEQPSLKQVESLFILLSAF